MDTRFGTWNIRSLNRIGSLNTIARKLGKYRLDLLGVQRSDGSKEAVNRQKIIYFSMEKEMRFIS
jgi:hypothetical protein